jgi:hypothetical protein
MNNFDKSMMYVSMLTETAAIKKDLLPEAMEFLTSIGNDVDLSAEVVDGMGKYNDMEAMDKLLLHKSLSGNKEYVKKIVLLKEKGPDYKYYPYMPEIINELLKDPKKCKQAASIISEISANYKETANNIGFNKFAFTREAFIKQIDDCFVMSPPYMEYLNSINKITNEPEVLNEEEDSEYLELTEAFLSVLSEVSVKDKIVKVAVDTEKLAEKLANTVNRMKEKYEAKAKQDKAEAIVKENWQIKKQLRRIIKSAPVAIINPAVAFLVYLSLTIADKKIDKRVRAEYIGDLKLEIKLLEDKIAEAERKDDNRSKVKLTREKDKLERALEKLLSGRA